MVQRISEVATWTLGVIANDRLTSRDGFWSVALLYTALSDPARDVAHPD
jgi:hypothetical protein